MTFSDIYWKVSVVCPVPYYLLAVSTVTAAGELWLILACLGHVADVDLTLFGKFRPFVMSGPDNTKNTFVNSVKTWSWWYKNRLALGYTTGIRSSTRSVFRPLAIGVWTGKMALSSCCDRLGVSWLILIHRLIAFNLRPLCIHTMAIRNL